MTTTTTFSEGRATTPTTTILFERRKIFKDKILTVLDFLETLGEITESGFPMYKKQVEDYFTSVDLLDEQIINSYLVNETEEETVKSFNKDCTLFRIEVLERLSRLQPSSKVVNSINYKESPVKEKRYGLTPKIECPRFSEKDLERDKLAFLNFKREFENCVVDLENDALKLVVLKNHLSGYAFQLIRHLSVSEENYRIASDILESEFLDKENIVDSVFSSILNVDKLGSNLAAKKFVNTLKAQVYELKNSFGLNFLETGSPGNRLLSHIVFGKLPPLFKSELVHKVGNNYPTLEEILENYSEISRTIEFCRYNETHPRKSVSTPRRIVTSKFKQSSDVRKPSTLENFYVKSSKVGYNCNFCRSNNHKGYSCKSFPTHADRLRRCKEIGLCIKCTSPFHEEKACYCNNKDFGLCWTCNKEGHCRALCPSSASSQTISNACWHLSSSSLLPIIEITVNAGSDEGVSFNCLIDSGSERSYLSSDLLDKFTGFDIPMKDRKFLIKTFLGREMKNLKEVNLRVKFSDSYHSVSFLVDDNMDLTFRVDGLNSVIKDLMKQKVKLAANFSELRNDTLPVYGLLGVDVLRFMGPMHLNNFRKGHVWESPQGIVLFGDITDFMSPQTVNETGRLGLNYAQVIDEHSSCDLTHVYFVLDPKSEYTDPLSCFEGSSVERTVEKLCSLETIGIIEDEVSDYDKRKIESFRSSIRFLDNSYYVSLPWNDDKLKSIPSNYQVSLAVLNRVSNKLTEQGLYNDYCQVFLDQEKEGIIERILVNPSDFGNYVWIPHRPVFKRDLQCTTKIRPVFNCSLRTGGKPSLNDCAYSGVNLYTDMLELLFKFRTDQYVLLADIRKAFLMIRLNDECDRDRFCFFLKLKNELICFRYKTLIFGFVSSPFILSYIVKYHVEKYPPSPCKEMLLSNFYVDNLIKTHRSANALLQLYLDAVVVMKDGGFLLKTCNSNSDILAERMLRDNNSSSHGLSMEKVLGYLYKPSTDKMQLSPCIDGRSASSKRDILSLNSSVFDPLGLALPVTIKGRILLSKLWKLGLSWDHRVPPDILVAWNKLYKDLVNIDDLEFDRFSVDSDSPATLIVFCDASNQAYGIAVYLYQHGEARLIFAKAKVAPSVKRTLPTLELLAVYLCMKHISVLVKVFPLKMLNDIIIAVDAQVVLSWILSDNVNTKCQFTRNRIKDVKAMVGSLSGKGLNVKFKYVKTGDNPADLITRGITLNKFKTVLNTWLFGPVWLRGDNLAWPSCDLNCLNSSSQILINTLTGCESSINSCSVIEVERFSSLDKLVGVLTVVFRFLSKLKGVDNDSSLRARIYLLKLTQNLYLSKEKGYLLRSRSGDIPLLVSKFNLFLDAEGLIRSRGRIDKSAYFSDDILHPILLPKSCHVTSLIIMDCHVKCKHLGIAATLSKLRMLGFWIPKARQAIKTVISSCVICRKYNSLSFGYPKVTNLPKYRVNLVKPFMHTGIDFTGHLWVHEGDEVKKMYILIFTCFSVRAVHLELLPDMTTQSVVLAFVRFFNVYGVPSHIYSDNALSFVAGCDLVKQVYLSDEFKRSFNTHHIKHQTIPLYSAWFGAVWERLIKVVKNCLFKIIGRKKLNYFLLLTVLSDIQGSVNDRPLTYRCSDDSSLEVITPNAFVRPFYKNSVFLNLENDYFLDRPPSKEDLIESLECRDKLLNCFKGLWYEQYLLGLRELSHDLYQSEFDNAIKLGDVVLIKNPIKSRPYWSLGRVINLTTGSDGLVRSALIRKSDGVTQEHSLKNLCPMELSITHSHQASSSPNDEASSSPRTRINLDKDNSRSRPIRSRRPLNKRKPEFIWY